MSKPEMDTIIKSPEAKMFLRMVTKDFYNNSYLGLWMYEVIGREWDEMREWAEELKAEIYPQTCTWSIDIWEWIYGIESNESLPLEYRRQKLLTKITGARPVNPETIRRGIAALAGIGVKVKVNGFSGPYQFDIAMYPGDIPLPYKQIISYVNNVKPAHIRVIYYVIIDNISFEVLIRYENRLTMNSGFYPRCNIPEIFLDASSYLDGTYPLNGYQHMQDISLRLLDATDLLNGRRLLDSFWEIQIPEFYPARFTVRGLFHNNLQFLQQLHIVLETLLSIRLEPSIQIASRFYPRNNIPLLYVNAEAALDGEFLLNGRMDIWNLSFLYLTGMASLDGVCSLNGYEDNPSYEFYPASMEIFANYQTPIRLSEQVHSVIGVQLPLPLTAASNLSMTSRFYPRYQPPAIYLNGGTKLDGTYSLHGREESEDIPSCFLNGEASLDGAYSLHGYQNNQDLGFYPATLQVQGEITQKIEVSSQSEVRWNTPLLIESESNCSIIGKANKEIAYETDLKLSGQIKQPVLWNPETMTVEYHVWYLDGKKGLNGQVCLDADIYEIEL